jgi:hypothetical protein
MFEKVCVLFSNATVLSETFTLKPPLTLAVGLKQRVFQSVVKGRTSVSIYETIAAALLRLER